MRCILRNPRVAVVRLLLVLDIPELDRASDAFIIGGRHTLPICDRCNYCSSLRYSTLYPSDEAEFLPRFVFHGSEQIFNGLYRPRFLDLPLASDPLPGYLTLVVYSL
jgi:hypothetical protein